jgi:hypothetical protein
MPIQSNCAQLKEGSRNFMKYNVSMMWVTEAQVILLTVGTAARKHTFNKGYSENGCSM